ncbi:MAG: hypothetical protein JJ839_005890 [Prochlorococcus marinus CUG1430]|uniref:hypothetical protein n=1 Tax=Prochlorococcus marinus TaxID=1219 RepID=UPI001FD6FD6B|nr:hypothetical protein [Prochlorococcus marinus]MCR8538008.1 hypothetical protein [Prochlorococcus marinus CUG1430]
MLKENIVLKWVHRFGIDSLNDLLIHTPVLREYKFEEENQEQISLESFKTLENLEETNCESNYLKISNKNQVFNTKLESNQIHQYIKTPKLPLPNIKNLRKWINKDKKAS